MPDFDPNDLSTVIWGEVTVRKVNNANVFIEFSPNIDHLDFNSKTSELTKLTEIHGLICQ